MATKTSYVEHWDHYLKVTQIEDGNLKKFAFITALKKRPYKTLKDVLLPATREDKSFEDVVNVLKEHYVLGSQVIAERFKSSITGTSSKWSPSQRLLLN